MGLPRSIPNRAYGWQASGLAGQRFREAVSEIKKVANTSLLAQRDTIVCGTEP